MRQETAETGATPRERYRAQVRAEIKDHARRQIATAGAPGLSLNAIAKRMGMSGPALYRYYAGRDELLTDLVRDAYRSLAEDFRAASAPAPTPGRWRTRCAHGRWRTRSATSSPSAPPSPGTRRRRTPPSSRGRS